MDWDHDAALQAEKELYTAMYRAKVLVNQKTADTPFQKYTGYKIAESILSECSKLTTKLFGTKDFIPFI